MNRRGCLALVVLLVALGTSCAPEPIPDVDADIVDAEIEDARRDAASTPDAGTDTPCDCDDGVACTVDTCVTGACVHSPDHAQCSVGLYCDPSDGCAGGEPCADVSACARPGACVVATCDASSRTCTYAALDGDLDGFPPVVCGGTDCDDADAAVHPGATELCDGVDSDCSGALDPSGAGGCRVDEVCDGTACACPSGETSCTDRFGTTLCVNELDDPLHCGGCDTTCVPGQACDDGECACLPGLTDCTIYGVCTDVMIDTSHCGTCGYGCGALSCVDGTCGCRAPAVQCSAAPYRMTSDECAVLASDPQHCGSCTHACLATSACTSGQCSADAAYFRAYGQWATGSLGEIVPLITVDATTGSSWTAVTSGVAFPTVSPRTALLPEGTATLWDSPHVLVQSTGSGDFVRAHPLPANVLSISAGAGRVGVGLAAGTATVTLAGTVVTRPAGLTAWGAAFVIDEAGGVVWARPMPGGTRLTLSNDGTATAAMYLPSAYDFGNGVTVAPSTTAANVLLWLSPTGLPVAARRVTGNIDALMSDALGRTLVVFEITGSADVTYGGDVFGSTERWVVVLYAALGVHQRSFAIDGPSISLLPSDDELVRIVSRDPEGDSTFDNRIERYAYAGSSATLVATSPSTLFRNVYLTGGVRVGSRVVLLGRLLMTAGAVGPYPTPVGWTNLTFVAELDPLTFEITAYGNVIGEGPDFGPLQFATAATSSGVLVAAVLGRRILIGRDGYEITFGGPLYDGFFLAALETH